MRERDREGVIFKLVNVRTQTRYIKSTRAGKGEKIKVGVKKGKKEEKASRFCMQLLCCTT